MKRSLRILCDMDSIIVNMSQKWIDLYNKDHNEKMTMDDVKNWDMAHNVKIGEKIYEYLYSHEFFLNVDPIEGALEALQTFQKEGHHLVIASAPSWPGNSASDKLSWLKKHAPFINKRDVMLGHNKYMLKGDVLIDDSPDNIESYFKHWPQADIMTIAYPYNASVAGLTSVYAESYKDTKSAWKQIVEGVEKLSNAVQR